MARNVGYLSGTDSATLSQLVGLSGLSGLSGTVTVFASHESRGRCPSSVRDLTCPPASPRIRP